MGSTLSILNDTDDVIMVKLTANTKVIVPIVDIGSAAVVGTLIIFTGGIAGIVATFALPVVHSAAAAITDNYQRQVQGEFEKNGYTKVSPGQEYVCCKRKKNGSRKLQTLSLNQRMWLVRIETKKFKNFFKTSLQTANKSVFTGKTHKSNNQYRASDTTTFNWKFAGFNETEIDGSVTDISRGGAIVPVKHNDGGHRSSRLSSLVTAAVLLLSSPQGATNYLLGGGKANARLPSLPMVKSGFAVKPIVAFETKAGNKHIGRGWKHL